MSKLGNKLHDALFTEEKPSHPTPAPAPAAAPTPATVPGIGFTPRPYGVAPATVTDNPDLYNQIFQKTDFDQTSAGQVLQKYLAPLANIPMDQSQKFKVALAQATAQEGLTADKVIATFDGLLVALQNETSAFSDAVAGQTDHEVTQRQNQIANIQAQIQQLQQQLTQLSTDSVTAQSKISVATNQFSMASSRRKLELEQQKAQYAAMLKG
jgi:glucuronate isomerase